MKRSLFCSPKNMVWLIAIAIFSVASSVQAQVQYRLEYGNLPIGTTYLRVYSELVEISDGANTAMVVPGSYRVNDGTTRGFIYDQPTGVFTDVHSLLGIDSLHRSGVTAINSSGIAVGSTTDTDGNSHAFWFDFFSTSPTIHYLDQQFPEFVGRRQHARGITSDGFILIRSGAVVPGEPPWIHFLVNPFNNGGEGELTELDMFVDVSGINDSRVVYGSNTNDEAVTYDAVNNVTKTFEELELISGSRGKINNFGEFCGSTYVTSGRGKKNGTKRYAARHDGNQITWLSDPIEVSLSGADAINDDGDVSFAPQDVGWFHHQTLDQSFELRSLVDDAFFDTAWLGDVFLSNRDTSLSVPMPAINGRAVGIDGTERMYFLVPTETPPTPGITVTPTSGLVTTEAGGIDSFDVVLDTQPTDDVTIGISSNKTAEGIVSASSLTFTSIDWDTPQTVTVTGIDDAFEDGNVAYTIMTAAATSNDADYNGLDADDVSVTNEDDDSPPGGGSETYSSDDTPSAIPDNNSNGVTSTILAGDHVITNLIVNLNIQHQRLSDVDAFLVGPDGTEVQLFNLTGDNAVASYDGTDSLGFWSVTVIDSRKKKTGTLNSWSIIVDYD